MHISPAITFPLPFLHQTHLYDISNNIWLFSSTFPKEQGTFITMKPFSNPNQYSKKTRDLPNLSQCQCCNFRIDICSGNTALNTLYSEWRIVLLCKDCFFLVESSQICSYCFKESSLDNPCNNCCNCNRIVHKSCVLEYGCVAPWSYCCSSSDLFTCVDCWIPKSLANKRRVPGSGKKRKFLESRSFKESYEQKSVEAALMAVRKALIARGAVELESNTVDMITEEGDCGADGSKNDGGDARFMSQLHRAMNSSPRIAEKFHVANSQSVSKRRLPGCNDETMAKLSDENISCGSAERQLVCGISRNFVCDSLGHVAYLTPIGADAIRMRQTANVAYLGLRQKEGENCSTYNLINLGADDDSTNCAAEFLWQENEILIPEGERCCIKRDEYLMKYSRRKLNEGSTPDSRSLSFFECVMPETRPLTIEPLQLLAKESPLFPNSSPRSPKVSIRSSGLTSQQNRPTFLTFRGADTLTMKQAADVENLKSQLKGKKICSNKLNPKCGSCMNSISQSFREGNAIMLPEDERCCRQPDRYLVKYSRRKSPIRYLLKYSRKKLKKRSRNGTSRTRASACFENSKLQPEEREEDCYSKWLNSSADVKNVNTAYQYFREENDIMIPEDEKCHPETCLMKYRRRKLNKRDGDGMLRMRESANVEKSESQPEGDESCYEKWISLSAEDKNTNTASQSCWKDNEVMVPEDEEFCSHLDRYVMKYNRRKLAGRNLKYYSRKLNKRNVAEKPKMRQTTKVECSESQPKEEEESCSRRLSNSSADDDSVNSASQSFSEEDEIMAPENERCYRHPISTEKSISFSDFSLESPLKASFHSSGLSQDRYR